MSTTLPLFWNLSSVNKKERLDASVKLISTLEKLQATATFVPKDSDATSNEDVIQEDEDEDVAGGHGRAEKTADDLNLLNAGDVSYSIRRLVRGLASPRESSRLGFSVALTEVRTSLPFCSGAEPQLRQALVPHPDCDMCADSNSYSGCLSNTRLHVGTRRT